MHELAIAIIDADVADGTADTKKQQVTDRQRGYRHRLRGQPLGIDTAWQVEP